MAPLPTLDNRVNGTRHHGDALDPVVFVYVMTAQNAPQLDEVTFPVGSATANVSLDAAHDDQIVPQITDAIEVILNEHGHETVFAEPSFAMNIGALHLAGLTVMTNVLSDGTRKAVVRVGRTAGSPLELFNPNAFETYTTAQALAHAIDDAIQRIYIPLTNLDQAMSDALEHSDTTDLVRLQKQFLSFKTEIELAKFGFERALRDGTVDRLRSIAKPSE